MIPHPISYRKSLLRSFLDATVPHRLRMGLTRPQIAHWWWKSVIRNHPQVLTTDLFPEETEILLNAFRDARPSTYLEIGVFWGGTFNNILQRRDSLSLQTKCFGLDVWDEIVDTTSNTHGSGWPIRNVVKRALNKRNLHNFELLSGLSSQAAQLINCKIDFTFHDANHTYAAVIEDLELLHPLMSNGAMMLVHNAGRDYEPDKSYYLADGGPYRAIMELVKLGRWELKALEYRVAVLKRLP